ncbi:hypothetical protein DICVIV_10336 [Dictyocaulus viviparus]|uniref:Metalloprotease TIKI homolog n=1 Tax=Dictyocaulus viviparus TaxID=29172 RepID=A0A0D8XG30_DICVI|nr:hypothetical protein DICVIV_10336 [Dictyocaulus viviparus]
MFQGERNTFLWSIRDPVKNSRGFLFGTIHVPYTEVWDRVMARFKTSLISWAQMQEAPVNESYRKAREIYDNLVGNWDRKRPVWLLFVLYQLCENLLDRPTSPMLDVFLANKAYEEEKQIWAIETAYEQCNPIVSLTQDEIIFAINYTISYLEHLHITQQLFHINTERSVSALVKEYRCGRLDDSHFEINEISISNLHIGEKQKKLAEKIDRQLRDDIIVKRNKRMASRLNQLLTDNPHLTMFSAIGTGHFFGNDSVLHHLKKMGYIVESIREDDVILSPRKHEKKLTFNSLWLRERKTVSTVSIEVIEINTSYKTLSLFSLLFTIVNVELQLY